MNETCAQFVAPTKIPAAQVDAIVRELVEAHRESPETCNCGWYGFRFALCPHTRFEVAVKWGLTRSQKTGRPIFCMKKAPTITLPNHVLPRKCRECWKVRSLFQVELECRQTNPIPFCGCGTGFSGVIAWQCGFLAQGAVASLRQDFKHHS
jgi:hypothetical protein